MDKRWNAEAMFSHSQADTRLAWLCVWCVWNGHGMKQHHKKIVRVLSWFVFAAYLVALVYFLFFSEQLGRVPSGTYKYSMMPFREIKRYVVYRREIGFFNMTLNLFGNILCFIPFGFVLPIMSSRHRGALKITFLSFLASLLVELIQLVSKVGSCDVDDIILNTLGGFLGYFAFWSCHRVIMHRDKKRRGRANGIQKEEKEGK